MIERRVHLPEEWPRVVTRVADHRLHVDHQPRLALRRQHVAGVEVAVHEDRTRRRLRERLEERRSDRDEHAVERRPEALHPLPHQGCPLRGDVGQMLVRRRAGRRAPEPLEEAGADGERAIGREASVVELRARCAPLDEQRPVRGLVFEQLHRTVAGPVAECCRLVTSLAVWPRHLQHRRRSRRDESRERPRRPRRLRTARPPRAPTVPASDATISGSDAIHSSTPSSRRDRSDRGMGKARLLDTRAVSEDGARYRGQV